MVEDKGAAGGTPVPPDPAQPNRADADSELTGHLLEAWKKTVDVQQHFNQIEMDIRKTAVTVIVAVVGAAGFAADRGMQFMLLGLAVNVALLIVIAGIVALGAFFWMDYFQYHRLLKGAVAHGMALEKALSARSVPVDLTKTIGNFSPVTLFGRQYRSDDKIRLFYQAIGLVLFVFAVAGSCGLPAQKPSPATPVQTLEFAPKAALQADVRVLSLPQPPPPQPTAAALPPTSQAAAAPSPGVPTPIPLPTRSTPAQTQTGPTAPQSSQ